jgi:YidC/Oxa1 family membrane protein insertase
MARCAAPGWRCGVFFVATPGGAQAAIRYHEGLEVKVNENKNMLLAIVLSAIVLLGWGLVTQYFFPAAYPPATKVERGKQVALPQPNAGATPTTPAANRDRRLVLGETPRVTIATPRLSGSINLTGARIDDLVLTAYREGLDPNSPPVRLFSPQGAPDAYFAGFGWTGQVLAAGGARPLAVPDGTSVWQASGTRLTPATPVTLSWNNGQGQIFEIHLAVDENYLFTAEQRLVNRGAAPVSARALALVSRVGATRDQTGWTNHLGPVGVFNGTANYEYYFQNVADAGTVNLDSRGGWLGFTDKYWLAAVVPDQGAAVQSSFQHNRASDAYQASFWTQPANVVPGRVLSTSSHIFAGAREVRLLEDYSVSLGTPLERAIDWGWFRWFMKPIFKLLAWLYAHIGNFGFTIICLTFIVRLLLFPIAQKQFASMAAMRAIQPKMKALQDRYADDKPRLQQEMLKLYKEERVNPAAGCLPVLLQIPIFYALYKVLTLSVEMRHQPWIGWIHDLSAPDPLSPVNLFGYLPFTPPHILAVGILPILVGFTMWLQMKLQPQAPDPVQRQMFALMPWVLMFIMAPFAAGLQLYWVTGNILSIAQQRFLYWRHPALRQQAATASPPPIK